MVAVVVADVAVVVVDLVVIVGAVLVLVDVAFVAVIIVVASSLLSFFGSLSIGAAIDCFVAKLVQRHASHEKGICCH